MWTPVLLLLASSLSLAASECRDSPHQARLCGLAPARGYCDLYPDWARLHCPASCSLCPLCSCQVTQE